MSSRTLVLSAALIRIGEENIATYLTRHLSVDCRVRVCELLRTLNCHEDDTCRGVYGAFHSTMLDPGRSGHVEEFGL